MSRDLLQKYKDYYQVRAEKYADNPNFKNTYSAEKQLSESVLSCSNLEEIKEKMGNLNEKCGIAFLKDQYILELEHFRKYNEIVRAGEAERILAFIDEFGSVVELMSKINEISSEERILISLDESHSMHFFGDLSLVEEYLMYMNAVVPESYKKITREILEDIKQSMIENLQTLEKNNSQWKEHWKLNPDICFEPRHFRISPLNKEHLMELRSIYAEVVQR